MSEAQKTSNPASNPAYDPGRTRILVVAAEAGPDPAATRAWRLAGALAADNDVMLALPAVTGLSHSAFAVVYYNSRNLALMARDSDAVVCEAAVLASQPSLLQQGRPVALDLAGLVPAAGLSGAAVQADFFFCESEGQRPAWLEALAAAGRDNRHTRVAGQDLRTLIDVALPDDADSLDGFCRHPRFAADRGTRYNRLKLPKRPAFPGPRHFLAAVRYHLRTYGLLSLLARGSAAKRGN